MFVCSPRRFLPALFFLLLALATTGRAVLGGEMFYFRDLLSHHVPHLALGARLWHGDGIPLWSPLFDCGQPHLANPQNLSLHPLQILYLLLPPDRAFAVSLTLLFFLCGFGMYVCARGLGASVAGALAAGAAFELSGFILSLGNLANLLATSAPLPLTFLFAVRAAAATSALWPLEQRRSPPLPPPSRFPGDAGSGEGGPIGPDGTELRSARFLQRLLHGSLTRDLAAAGALFALQILGGEPFVAALCLLGIATVLPWVAQGSLARRLAGTAAVAGCVGALAALLDAAVLLPAFAFYPDTVRAWGFRPEGALLWSLHPARLLEVFLPGIFGNPISSAEGAFWGAPFFDRGRAFILGLGIPKVALLGAAAAIGAGFTKRFTTQPTAGAGEDHLPAGCSACATVHPGATPPAPEALTHAAFEPPPGWTPRLARGLAWTAAAFTLLALGRHGLLRLEWLGALDSLPLVRYPVRFFLVPTFALCLLSAFGFETLAAGARRIAWGRTCLGICGALALLASVGGALAAGGWLPDAMGRGVAGALARSALPFALLCAALLAPGRRGWSARWRVVAVVAIAAAEPLWLNAGLNPAGPREILTRKPAAVELLQADPGRFRIWRDNSPRLEGLPDYEAPFLAYTIWFRDTLHPSYGMEYDLAYAFNTSGDESDSKRTFLIGKRLAGADLQTRARVLGAAGVKYLLAFVPPPGEGAGEASRSAPSAAGDGVGAQPAPALETAALIPLDGPDLWVWRNRLWVPTVRVVGRAFAAGDGDAALDRLVSAEHDAREEVILEEFGDADGTGVRPPVIAPNAATAAAPDKARQGAATATAPTPTPVETREPAGTASITAERSGRLTIQARADRDAYLVVSDRYAPGWEARLDGEPVLILRADYFFRAVRLPPGEHTVEFVYRPASFRLGCLISLIALAAVAFLLITQRRRGLASPKIA